MGAKTKKKLLGTTRIPLPGKTGGPHRDKSKYRRKPKHATEEN